MEALTTHPFGMTFKRNMRSTHSNSIWFFIINYFGKGGKGGFYKLYTYIQTHASDTDKIK